MPGVLFIMAPSQWSKSRKDVLELAHLEVLPVHGPEVPIEMVYVVDAKLQVPVHVAKQQPMKRRSLWIIHPLLWSKL